MLTVSRPNPNTRYIIDAYQSGRDGLDIAGEFDCHPTTIYAVLKRAGIARRPTFGPQEGRTPWNKGNSLKRTVNTPDGPSLEQCWPMPTARSDE